MIHHEQRADTTSMGPILSGNIDAVSQREKTRHYIFDDYFNVNCPIAIIFGTLITH